MHIATASFNCTVITSSILVSDAVTQKQECMHGCAMCNCLITEDSCRLAETGVWEEAKNAITCLHVHKNYCMKGHDENYAEQCNVIHLLLVCVMHKTQQASVVCINCTMID